MIKNLKSSVLGIIILVIGVIIGVILVRQTQIFKNQAKEKINRSYTVCHKTGNIVSQWEEITVTADELPSYLNRGDIFGECPKDLNN